MTPHKEVEIKLALATPADHDRLLAHLGLPVESRTQHNVFFDTPTGDLARRQVVLRVRTETRARPGESQSETLSWLTLKGAGLVDGEVHVREEVECRLGTAEGLTEIRRDPSALLARDLPPIRALDEIAGRATHLVELGGFVNVRRIYHVALGSHESEDTSPPDSRSDSSLQPQASSLMVWEVDATRYPGGRMQYELEVELDAPLEAAAVTRAIHERLRAFGVRYGPQPLSKFARLRQFLREVDAQRPGSEEQEEIGRDEKK